MTDIPGTNNYNPIYIGPHTTSNSPAYNGQPVWTFTIGTHTVNTPITIPSSGQISMPLETPAEPAKKKDSEGLSCRKCDEYYPMAEANQTDGTLVCYACRHNL